MSRGTHLRAAFIAYAAGAVGGLVNWLLPALFTTVHLFGLFRIHETHSYARSDLYAKVFWGALWGLIFLADVKFFFAQHVKKDVARALIYGLFPALAQILVVYPFQYHEGFGGVKLGWASPLLLLFFNTIGWSLPAYAAFQAAGLGKTHDGILGSEPLLA